MRIFARLKRPDRDDAAQKIVNAVKGKWLDFR
jgi:hypothetical protein